MSTMSAEHHSTSFTLFALLPTELRLKIWTAAVTVSNKQQIIAIRFDRNQELINRGTFRPFTIPLSLCCSEASLVVAANCSRWDIEPTSFRLTPFMFRPDIDVVKMHPGAGGEHAADNDAAILAEANPEFAKVIRKVALVTYSISSSEGVQQILETLSTYESLDELIIVSWGGFFYKGSPFNMYRIPQDNQRIADEVREHWTPERKLLVRSIPSTLEM